MARRMIQIRRAWWNQPVGAGPALGLAALVIAATAWLMADTVRTFALFGDDFRYMADARDGPTLWSKLFVPHNTHVVPLFRLWTFALSRLAASRADWPLVFGLASFAGLIVAMLAVGHFVARETRLVGAGLASMALLGISTTIEPAVEWYAAGQALWSGSAVVVTLIVAQSWRASGGAWRLVAALVAALAAPMLWSGGLVAGPASAAYLACDGRRAPRRAAWLFLGVMAASAAFILVASRGTMAETEIIWEEHPELWPRPVQAILHTAQAIPEALVGRNLGIEVVTGAAQGLILTLALAAAWAWTRRRVGFRPAPLEAAGAVIVAFSYGMAYFFRGNLPFSSLREVQWYHAVPHLGAVLFVVGWWTGHTSELPGAPRMPTRRGVARVALLVAALLLLQRPLYRLETIREANSPRLAGNHEAGLDSVAVDDYRDAIVIASDHATRQRGALASLDEAERRAASAGVGRAALLDAFGHASIPGMPDDPIAYNAVHLLRLPERGVVDEPAEVRALLGEYFVELEAR